MITLFLFIEPRVAEQLIPTLPIFYAEFGGLNTQQNFLRRVAG